MRRGPAILLCLALTSCDPNWGGGATNKLLDNKEVAGCYHSRLAPPLHLKRSTIDSDGLEIYNNYTYGLVGRGNEKAITVYPRMELTKNGNKGYYFKPSLQDKGPSFSFLVSINGDEVSFDIISMPDMIYHTYTRGDCG